MSGLILRGAVYTKVPQPAFPAGTSTLEIFQNLTSLIGQQVNQVTGDNKDLDISDHVVTSTIVEAPFSTGEIRWDRVAEMTGQHCAYPPTAFLNAYECAGWGYALRYFFKMNPAARLALVTIFDVNIYNYKFWTYNSNWEHSGFGIATLLIERNSGEPMVLHTGVALSHNPMAEFAMAIRNHLKTADSVVTALPFFPKPTQDMLDRILGAYPRLPDIHRQWGHCFGSDPWIGIINRRNQSQATEAPQSEPVLACSLALNGYFSFAEIQVPADALLRINDRLPYPAAQEVPA